MRTTLAFAALAAAFVQAKLDPNLHRSFYGIGYSSDGVILPDCGAQQDQVTQDILLLAQITPRVHTYGSDCNQTALVMQAIHDTNVDLTFWPAVYITAPFEQEVVDRQLQAVKEAFDTYGVDHVGGLTIGNEFLLNSYGTDGVGKATDAKGVAARTQLLKYIKEVNDTVKSWNLSKDIPIGTSDAASAVTEQLCGGIDYFFANDHAWFAQTGIDTAATWVWNFFQTEVVDTCKDAKNPPAVYIGETGWPSDSDNATAATSGGSDASIENLQKYLDTFVCEANNNGTEYFYFAFHDNKWAGATYGGVEGHWGIFDENRNLKQGLTLPTCLVDSPTGGTVDQSILAKSDSTQASAALSATQNAGSPVNNNRSGALLSTSVSVASLLGLVASTLWVAA